MSKITEILSLFVEQGEPFIGSKIREQMVKPYLIDTDDGNVYACATDAHAIVYIPSGHLHSTDVTGNKESELGIATVKITEPLAPQTRVIQLDAWDALIKNIRMTDELHMMVRTCEECDGHGTVEWEYGGHTKEDDCPECDGMGKCEQETPTGRMVPDYKYSLISLNPKHGHPNYSCEQLKRVMDTCKLCGATEVAVHEKTGNGIDFMLNTGEYPGIRITVMPVVIPDDVEWDAIGEYQIYAKLGEL